VCFSILLECNT